MRRVAGFAALLIIITGATAAVATISPRGGGPMPADYIARIQQDPTAYRMSHAWVQKTRRIKEERQRYLDGIAREQGPSALMQLAIPAQYAVSGTFSIPVFAGYFQSQSPPAAATIPALQSRIFGGVAGSVSDWYDEVSYGDLALTGTVYGWTQVSQNDTYYAGTSNGKDPANAHVGEFIKELLDAYDGAVNFGQYDNDGPDGVPNSGDDDGFVDVISVIHNESGGECTGNNNIWSHSWRYSGWPISGGVPYTTNDAKFGGGFIQVEDYTIEPAVECDGSTLIKMGVFCHEFGHAFGLPDLYDINNGGYGIGDWGIMGSGNWNTTDSPAHPCAWTRMELGWVTPVTVDWTNASANITNIESGSYAFRLPFTNDRFRRSNACVINGSWSLYCGYTAAEGTARHWASPGPGGGYGSNWRETVRREFDYSGSGPVTLSYAYSYDTEPGYDYGYAIVDVGGTESIVATYNGTGSGTASIPITSALAPLSGVGGTYSIKFRVVSDISFADDDGYDPSSCGALIVDDVAVTGGGETYSTDFESYADGWYQEPAENPATEYWLVENRRLAGYDAHLHGQGLVVLHVDESAMFNPFLGNSGGTSNVNTRGVVVEEANNDFDLNGAGANKGENTDIFPGAANVTSFTGATAPNTNDNCNRGTQVQITNISAAAPTMTANMRAGDRAPSAASIAPSSVDNDLKAVQIAVTGNYIRHGATFHFTNPTVNQTVGVAAPQDGGDIVAASIGWVDPTRLVGTCNVYSKTAGTWDLVVTNPDGQTFTLPGALTVVFKVATQLVSASARAVDGAVELSYELSGQEEGEIVRLYRSTHPDAGWRVIAENLEGDARGVYAWRDTDVEPGVTYYYLLESRLPDGTSRELNRASATVPAGALMLAQNVPNPFNPTTSIHFYLPKAADVVLDVYDISGARVRRLAGGGFAAGPHDVPWNGRNDDGAPASSGVYFYRLTAGTRTLTRKMVLLK